MSRIGSGVAARRLQRVTRSIEGGRIRPGGEKIAQKAVSKEQESLLTEVDGVMQPVFVFGVHAPGDPKVTRYVR